MASEGTGGEQPPPIQTLVTAVHGSVEAKCELNMDNLSRPELLTLLSIMEGELEARDLVIEALRARRKDVFLQERYGHFSLTDPFLALQRDFESGPGEKDRRPVSANPVTVLEAVMAHCRKMQERMSAQLAAAESRQKRLEQEKLQLQSLEQEHRKLSAQLKDEREKNKHIVMMLVRECKQLSTRVMDESQRFKELSARADQEGRSTGRLEEELAAERRHSQQMEAEMEKQLAEFDTEREQLRARLGREEARAAELRAESEALRRQVEQLRTERDKDAPPLPPASPAHASIKPKATVSTAVGTEPISCRTASSQTDPLPEQEGPKKAPLTIPVKPTAANYAGMSLPKTPSAGRSLHPSIIQAENGSEGQPAFPPSGHGSHSSGGAATAALPTGVSPRVQAARYKFQASPSEQDQNGTANQSPPSRDLSPTNRDNFAAKQQARHTVTQVLSRFTSPPTGGPAAALRPGLPHSASEGGPFPGRLGHPQIGLKSPTVGRIDRGNPPPIPPKKPGLSQTPSPPHPPIKVVGGEGGRSPGLGLGGGPGKSTTTPQLPPKPALDVGGAVPALTASQVGGSCAGWPWEPQQAACTECSPVSTSTTSNTTATIVSSSSSLNPTSAPSRIPQHPGSPLAAASGWCPSIVPSLSCGDPVPLDDGHTLLFQAASQGNATLLSMLLNQNPTTDICHLQPEPTSALFSAARNGHTDCVKLLLTSGVSADVSDQNGFTPLHIAAAHGQHGCVEMLLAHGADVERECVGGRTPLFLACERGSAECVKALLDAGADRSQITSDSCTTLHVAVSLGHVGVLQLLLYHPSPVPALGHHAHDSHPDPSLASSLLNHANRDGWTAAHIAASRGFKECLEVLCSHSQQDIEKRDKCNRTIHDVATDDCKDLLENLDSYKVMVQVQMGSTERLCPVDVLENGSTIGTVTIQRHTGWEGLGQSLIHLLTNHFQLLCEGWEQWEGLVKTNTPLGLSTDSVASVTIGDAVWSLGQELTQSPWDLIRKRLSQRITIRLNGLAESALDEMAYDSLIPLQLLQNYVRLVEQYHNVIFHGLEGSCQEYLANQISQCIKYRQEAMGISCDIVRVEIDKSFSKQQLVETFINCGFLVSVRDGSAGQRLVVVLLEGLERAQSLSQLLGDLCDGLDNRGSVCTLSLSYGQDGLYYFQEDSFLIGSLAKARLQGPELRLQQHFRWVQLRWDSEPLSGLLARHLRRKLLHKMQGQHLATDDSLHKALLWVCSVWHHLNACLSRLGTHEALLGPHMFLSCPVVPNQTLAVLKWLVRLWNAVVVPRVEDAVVSRVMAKRSPSQRRSPTTKSLSSGQRAVVRAALSILLNKAVLQGCPLARPEIERHLSEFQGGSFPLSAIGSSYKKGGKKGRESGAWRRASTSPRKKVSSTSDWSCISSLQEGSLASTDVHFMANVSPPRVGDGESVTLSLCSDDETDLIRELQTMCSSKSEPNISQIAQSKEDFIMFSGLSSGQSPPSSVDEDSAQSRPQPGKQKNPKEKAQSSAQETDNCHSHVPAPRNQQRTTRPRSQLPVPSNRGLQRAHSAPRVSSHGNSSSPAPGRASASTGTSSRTRQAQPNNSNNKNHNSQSEEEIWILHSKLHENYSNHE
ncbi:cortactin-binding protein 2 [Chanos chanos]|uniref:Cortactin-binding protein 2 n=1 Tax=Chanos chanos TaxID=29144 RepID=A0A6J2W6H4_CHACN|nr:cortactin-binding protein 2 [Chanos chanos]